MEFDSMLPVSSKSSAAGISFENSLGDASKKIRKPYTLTKSRQNWSDVEHDKFIEALHLFDRDWKKIEAFVGSKTAIQIRSHAQKYFLKVEKSGTNEHVPPPRPKRKAAHPYPHKASRNDVHKVIGNQQSATDLINHDHIIMTDSSHWRTNPWMYDTLPPPDGLAQDDVRSHNCCSSSIDSGPGKWPAGETTKQHEVQPQRVERVVPDFPKVYRFIGGIFDPRESQSNHLQDLKTMDPVDIETVILLMKNLCANLKSPLFEDYRELFSSYDAGTRKVASTCGLEASPRNSSRAS